MEVIRIEKLNFLMVREKILNDVDLKITDNKATVFLDLMLWKNYTLKNILGYLHNNSGNIEILDKNSREYTQKEKSKCISLVPQKSQLMSAMEVEDFVSYGGDCHIRK